MIGTEGGQFFFLEKKNLGAKRKRKSGSDGVPKKKKKERKRKEGRKDKNNDWSRNLYLSDILPYKADCCMHDAIYQFLCLFIPMNNSKVG